MTTPAAIPNFVQDLDLIESETKALVSAIKANSDWTPEGSKATRELMKVYAAKLLVSSQHLVGGVRIVNRQVNGDVSA